MLQLFLLGQVAVIHLKLHLIKPRNQLLVLLFVENTFLFGLAKPLFDDLKLLALDQSFLPHIFNLFFHIQIHFKAVIDMVSLNLINFFFQQVSLITDLFK